MRHIHVVYGAQSLHISDPGGILQRAKISQGKFLPYELSDMMHVSMYCIVCAFFVNIVNALSFGNSNWGVCYPCGLVDLVIHSFGLTVLYTSGIFFFFLLMVS